MAPVRRAGGAGAAGGAGGRAGGAGWRTRGGARGGGARGGGDAPFNVNKFYESEGVVALFDRGANSDMSAGGSDLTWQTQRADGGTVFVGSQTGGGRDTAPADAGLPQVTLAVEHYNRMVRLLDHQVPVRVELNVEAKFHEETPSAGQRLQRHRRASRAPTWPTRSCSSAATSIRGTARRAPPTTPPAAPR